MSDEPNNIDVQLARGDIKAALAAQTQEVTSIVLAEQITRSEQLTKLTDQQRQHNEALATTLERLAFSLRGDWNTFRADLREEMDARFKARDEQVDTLVAHLEERIVRPFSELPPPAEPVRSTTGDWSRQGAICHGSGSKGAMTRIRLFVWCMLAPSIRRYPYVALERLAIGSAHFLPLDGLAERVGHQ